MLHFSRKKPAIIGLMNGKDPQKTCGLCILGIGLLLFFMEAWKQLYLYYWVFDRRYNVWYLPWQLCSMPVYLCPLYGLLSLGSAGRIRRSRFLKWFLPAAATFLMDFGMLGGVAALLVPEGFLHPGHPFLSLHGYLWHILLIALSLLIACMGAADTTKAGFLKTLPLFFLGAGVGELLNVLLRDHGDCDMFYISPYHLSSQPVFRDIDAALGRIPGIFIYLAAILLGAFLIHLLLSRLSQRLHGQRVQKS